eukprot:2888574-Pleurochrysis_carterae.AAC.1
MPWRRTVRSIFTVPGGLERELVLLDSTAKRERPYDGRLVLRVSFDSFGYDPGRDKIGDEPP